MVSLRSLVRFCYFLFVLDVPFSIFSFPIRPPNQAHRLVSHPPPSARSSPRSRPPFSKTSRVRTSCTTPCGLVASSICFEFVVLFFLFQLTFTRRLLVSSYLTFTYKYPVPASSRAAIRLGVIPPSLSLSPRVILESRRPPDDYLKPTYRTSSDCSRDLYVSPLSLYAHRLDCAARPYRLKSPS